MSGVFVVEVIVCTLCDRKRIRLLCHSFSGRTLLAIDPALFPVKKKKTDTIIPANAVRAYRGRIGIAPLIRNLGTRWW
jgi:hypothetical protein